MPYILSAYLYLYTFIFDVEKNKIQRKAMDWAQVIAIVCL